jgi:hypothetical protein
MDSFSTFDIDSVVVYQVFVFWHLFPPVHCCLCCFSFIAFGKVNTYTCRLVVYIMYDDGLR